MKMTAKIIVILLVLLGEFAWMARPHISAHGPVIDESYRHKERFATWVASSEHPSPETKAAFDAEVKLLDEHMTRRQHGTFAVALIINVVGIYFFLRYAPKTTTV